MKLAFRLLDIAAALLTVAIPACIAFAAVTGMPDPGQQANPWVSLWVGCSLYCAVRVFCGAIR